jgi:hypothetical protein
VSEQGHSLTQAAAPSRAIGKWVAILFVCSAAFTVTDLLYGSRLVRFARESFMQSVTSGHYEVLSPKGALTPAATAEFAAQREPLFAALNKKLGNAASSARIRVVFDPKLPPAPSTDISQPTYSVDGTTVRTRLSGTTLRLPEAADAGALLYPAWGAPGNEQVARWIANWLVGDWRGAEIGMAAAQVEQRLGHKNVESLLVDPGAEIASPDDRTLLGAAWISEIAEFGGTAAVRKLYSAKMPHPNVAAVAKALGATPLELDRKWQLWIYAYLAGMPAAPGDSSMPMNMPMAQ